MPKPINVLLSSTILVTFATAAGAPLADADMRGRVVCDVPADEAVLLTWQVDDGSWRATTPNGGTASFPTEADAFRLWNELPVFVCNLTVEVGFRERPGRLHRLNRSMRPPEKSAGVTHAAEADPRVLIAGPAPRAPITAETCAEKWLQTPCWMELANHPGCYVWNPSLGRNETAAWTGGCSGGIAHGTGLLIWSPEGFHEIVTGRLDHGRREGDTVIRRTNGSTAEGPYVDGQRHGAWRFREADGSTSEGPYVDGQRHGAWRFREADGSTSEGPYVDGQRHGAWRFREADGSTAEGPYVNGQSGGTFTLRFPDGSVHKGFYSHVYGVQDGPWSRRDAGGNEAEGFLADGKESGMWVFRFADGDEMKGPYVDGLRHGVWTRRFADGAVEKGRYVNGEKQGTWIVRDGKFRYRTKYLDGRPKGKARDAIEW